MHPFEKNSGKKNVWGRGGPTVLLDERNTARRLTTILLDVIASPEGARGLTSKTEWSEKLSNRGLPRAEEGVVRDIENVQ